MRKTCVEERVRGCCSAFGGYNGAVWVVDGVSGELTELGDVIGEESEDDIEGAMIGDKDDDDKGDVSS